ncbi:hypothetical protein [Roseiflexus sp.]|uniref:hypothetical protein n=1 Tax=Roseiflexus sp. TaxID=2562120 RepID=UPI0021DCC652|nr:hypothetical protein [Roseiflexus sp.]GIW01246.1 MAG: hypothetical protein KatS3mg058_2649 [Roseiflexus sp.]
MTFLRDPKRLIATIVAGVAGLLVLIDFAGPVPGVSALAQITLDWAALVAALALVIGVVNVTGHHIGRVVRRSADWKYSLILLAAMVIVIVAGTLFPLQNPDGSLTVPSSLIEQPVRLVFRAVYTPLASSLLALLTFFSLSAALRAVRRRTGDALVIVTVALVVLIAASLPQLERAPVVADGVRWLSDYVVLAGARGLLIGAAIGALVAGVRLLLGFDQPYLDR